MQGYDPQKAARVWERVRQGSPASLPPVEDPQPELSALAASELAQAAVLEHMAQKASTQRAQKLRQLARDCRKRSASVKGICVLLGLQSLPATGSTSLPLTVCCQRSLELLEQYRRLTSLPHHGPLFAALAQQMIHHCLELTQLLGE